MSLFSKKKITRDSKIYAPASFAHRKQMITSDEYSACLRGDAEIQDMQFILNLNAKLTFPTGTRERIYQGRATEIMIDRLLNLDPDET